LAFLSGKKCNFALNGGLCSDGFQSDAMKKTNHPGLHDFLELARRFGINEKRRDKLLKFCLQLQPMVEELIRIKTKNQLLKHCVSVKK
jgi:hypothetical protein